MLEILAHKNPGTAARRLLLERSCIHTYNNDYRYWLARHTASGSAWNLSNDRHPGIVFIMLNPSRARTATRDPTDRRCQAFAHKFKAHWYGIVNLFANSSPHPTELFDFGYDRAIGDINDVVLAAVFRECLSHRWPVVCAWGTPSLPKREVAMVRQRALQVMTAYNARKVACADLTPLPLYCLAHTAEGWPRHPLYLSGVEAELRKHSIDTYAE